MRIVNKDSPKMFLSERLTIYISVKNTFNTTNLNNIVFFSFCRSLYWYI